MKDILWVSKIIGDLRTFCMTNDLPRSTLALDAALLAFSLDNEHRSEMQDGINSPEGEKYAAIHEDRPKDLPVGTMAVLTPDQYNSN